MIVQVKINPEDWEIVWVLIVVSEQSSMWFSNLDTSPEDDDEASLPPDISINNVIFMDGGPKKDDSGDSISDGVLVYFEVDKVKNRAELDTVRVFDMSAEAMAKSHKEIRESSFRRRAMADSIAAHMNVSAEDVPRKLFEMEITPEEYTKKNDLGVHSDAFRQSVIAKVFFP
ncbi:MAG: hypothetical protein K9K86_09835 [Pseudomonadales bacterium]|nr:hypothetical protein [Pseudomonadales bacterium]